MRIAAALAAMMVSGMAWAQALVPYSIAGDGIERSLTGEAGDPGRGRTLALNRDSSCILCHAMPAAEQRFAGDLGPPLAGVGARFTAAQLRLRLVDSRRVNPQTIMPAYHSIDGWHRVVPAQRDRPLLSAGDIEDLVAYLTTLK